ncbi:hypothetical protein BDR07DRAFT_1245791, partial [Suillus spraguei]
IVAPGYPPHLRPLGHHIGCPDLQQLVQHFLYDQLNPASAAPCHEVDISLCPLFYSKVSVFHSATTSFYAPSDICGVSGMHRQVIRSLQSWRGG